MSQHIWQALTNQIALFQFSIVSNGTLQFLWLLIRVYLLEVLHPPWHYVPLCTVGDPAIEVAARDRGWHEAVISGTNISKPFLFAVFWCRVLGTWAMDFSVIGYSASLV